jgi:hypothetical protein
MYEGKMVQLTIDRAVLSHVIFTFHHSSFGLGPALNQLGWRAATRPQSKLYSYSGSAKACT